MIKIKGDQTRSSFYFLLGIRFGYLPHSEIKLVSSPDVVGIIIVLQLFQYGQSELQLPSIITILYLPIETTVYFSSLTFS